MQEELLEPEELEALIKKFPKWAHQDGSLHQEFQFHDFAEAFGFLRKVAEIAEDLDHHPDWFNSWNRVSISISTHSAGGLTALDRKFVEKVESLEGF